jgi:hypothetical protein
MRANPTNAHRSIRRTAGETPATGARPAGEAPAREAPTREATVLTLVPAEITASQLHAYVDHALAPAERIRVEALLARRPLERVKVAGYRALNLKLRALAADRTPAMPESLPKLVERVIDRFGRCEDEGPLFRGC